MVFYAYAKNSNDDWSYRYVIVAPNFKTLDDWYNEVKDKVADNVLWRVSNDFYVFDQSKFELVSSTAAGHEAPNFMNRLIFQLLNDSGGTPDRGISTFINGHLSGGTAE